MIEKIGHLAPRIRDFDSRFGWQRDISMGSPSYSLWRIFKGKRYLIMCSAFTRNTPRSIIADELMLSRLILRKYMARCLAAGKTVEHYTSSGRDEVAVMQYRRGQSRWKD
jgi:hypothetical protein